MENSIRETDYLIIGAGAMGLAFADEIFSHRPDLKITIVDRREKPGGHWLNAYPFVRLHQPAAFYGVNSLELGSGAADLSSKPELLAYFETIVREFEESGRVVFLAQHEYLGDGRVKDLQKPENIIQFKVNRKLVDATYMNVEVPATHAPKYTVDEGVPLVPINELATQYDKWERFYVIGCGKTGIDAVLYLLDQGVSEAQIHWIAPNDAWLFNREQVIVGKATGSVLGHAITLRNAATIDEVFVEKEKEGSIMRLDDNITPLKWRCATVSPQELVKLRGIKQIIRKGRVVRLSENEIELQEGKLAYRGKALFVDCSANGLSKRKKTTIFDGEKITLQSMMFCQQVFSAAVIARMELKEISDKKKNQILPVPHPEYKEDWPSALAVSIKNLLVAHWYFPWWMFRARLNFMSHESVFKYLYYSAIALLLSPSISKAARRLDRNRKAQQVAVPA